MNDYNAKQAQRDMDDGRPCNTDVFLAAAIQQIDNEYDLRDAIKCWIEGDWQGALEEIELP